jgi:hypothetical protein
MQVIRSGILNTAKYQIHQWVYRFSSKLVKGSNNGKFSKLESDYKVLIFGDSHSRGLSIRLKHKLSDCNVQTLLSIKNQELINLANKDVLVFLRGTNDMNSDNSSRDLWHFSQFVKQNTQQILY